MISSRFFLVLFVVALIAGVISGQFNLDSLPHRILVDNLELDAGLVDGKTPPNHQTCSAVQCGMVFFDTIKHCFNEFAEKCLSKLMLLNLYEFFQCSAGWLLIDSSKCMMHGFMPDTSNPFYT